MTDSRLQELEVKVAFLERHLETLDKSFNEVNDQLRKLGTTVERLASQQSNNQGPGGEETGKDAVPPHY